jgi:hypothetical protein
MSLPDFERNFAGAVRLAYWIKLNNWYVSKEGKVNVSDGCIWPAFKNAVSKQTGKQINLHFRDNLKNTSISLANPNNSYDILISPAFNFCYRRFAICKELCHILTDDATTVQTDPVKQLQIALETVEFVQNAPTDFWKNPLFTGNPLSSENFCFLLALEILIPTKDRDKMVTDITNGVNPYDIAFRLRIPELLVKFYVKSGYWFLFKRVIKDILG